MNPTFPLRTFGALLTLCLAPACFPLDNDAEPEVIPLQLERSSDTLRFSWEGDKIHHLDVVQCDGEPLADTCGCNGALVWGLGPSETEKFHDVALEAPFISSPLEYGVTPESDRKAYASRALVSGKHYVVRARRVGPCDNNPQDCQQTIALGCQRFVW
jgi:hypothetical protein